MEKILQSERLIIRRFNASAKDMQALFSIMADKEVNTYLPWLPFQTLEETEQYYQNVIFPKYQRKQGYFFAVCLKDNDIPIGYVSVSGSEACDFGYALDKTYWNKGIVTEAGKMVIGLLKEEGWPYITATHDVNNLASGRVMQKLGMKYAYSYKEQWQPKNILVTFRMYQLNLDDNEHPVYMDYWNRYPEHFVEDLK